MRARANVKDMMPLPKAFHVRTAGIYSTMVSRFAEKRYKTGRLAGRVRQVGMTVPFDLEAFRAWVLDALGGKPDGCALCHYCRRPLCAEDFFVEHKTPSRRGGTLGFENLAISCDECNRWKGSLTEEEFLAFRAAMDELVSRGKLMPDGYQDIMKRLKGQNIILDAWHRKKKPENAPPGQPQPRQLALEEPF
jgi:HNH endonuclease